MTNEIMTTAKNENSAVVVAKTATPAKTKKAVAKKPQRVNIDDFVAACDRAAVTVHNRATNHSTVYRIVGGNGGTSLHAKKTIFIIYATNDDFNQFEQYGAPFECVRDDNAVDKVRPHLVRCENTDANLKLVVNILSKNSFNKSR